MGNEILRMILNNQFFYFFLIYYVNVQLVFQNIKFNIYVIGLFFLIDRCDFDVRDKVEEIQMLFIDVFQYFFKKRLGNESGFYFLRIMNVFLKLREMNEEFLIFYKEMCEDFMI